MEEKYHSFVGALFFTSVWHGPIKRMFFNVNEWTLFYFLFRTSKWPVVCRFLDYYFFVCFWRGRSNRTGRTRRFVHFWCFVTLFFFVCFFQHLSTGGFSWCKFWFEKTDRVDDRCGCGLNVLLPAIRNHVFITIWIKLRGQCVTYSCFAK